MKDQGYVGNVPAQVGDERLHDLMRAVGAFLELLPSYAELSPGRIAFVVDGMRGALGDDATLAAAESSYFGVMRRYFGEQARELGYESWTYSRHSWPGTASTGRFSSFRLTDIGTGWGTVWLPMRFASRRRS